MLNINRLGKQLSTLIKNPRFLGPGVNRYVNRLYHTNLGKHDYNMSGHDIFAEDWDNLIILDACKYQALREHMDRLPEGSLEERESRGSMSREWVIGNFNKDLYDVIYISANMFYPRLRDSGKITGNLHAFRSVRENIEKNYGVVTPEMTTERAKKINKEFPTKRLIIHYIQPHSPYLGKVGRKHFDTDESIMPVCRSSQPDISPDIVREAYEENLKLALNSVSELVEELNGRSVISADHGELLGDRARPIPVKDWGHPAGIHTRQLTRVPWYVVDHNDRKRIVTERPGDSDGAEQFDSDKIKNRMSDLGYL